MNSTYEPQSDASDHMDSLLPKATITYRQSQREIDRINLLKKIVPALTVVVFIALVLWPVLNNKEGSFTLAIDRLDKRDENAKLIKPRYVGMDKYNNPVNISAETAFRKSNDQKDYYLKNLLAELKMQDGTAIKILALSGMFDAEVQQIILDGAINLTTDNGFTLSTEQALFTINEKIASGENGVSGTMPFGAFTADKFNVNVDQEVIKLQGRVKLHFDPDKPMKLPSLNRNTDPQTEE